VLIRTGNSKFKMCSARMLEKILLLISTAVYKTDALLYIQYAQFNCLKPNDPLVGRAVRYLNLPHVLTSPYGVANMYRIWKDFVHLCTSWTAMQLHVVGRLNVKAALWCNSFFLSSPLSPRNCIDF